MLSRESLFSQAKPVTNYNQSSLLDKIAIYYAAKGKKVISGCCSGLTALWHNKMANNDEQSFYQSIKKIVDQPDDRLNEISWDIEDFYKQFYDLQAITERTNLLIQQRDIDKLSSLKKTYTDRKFYNGKKYNLASLKRIFDIYFCDNTMMRLSSNAHAIGIFRRDLKYYLYDANYKTGMAQEFALSDFKMLFLEIIKCLKLRRDLDNEAIEMLKDKLEVKLKIDVARPLRLEPRRCSESKVKF